jgi:hypothetical protein
MECGRCAVGENFWRGERREIGEKKKKVGWRD